MCKDILIFKAIFCLEIVQIRSGAGSSIFDTWRGFLHNLQLPQVVIYSGWWIMMGCCLWMFANWKCNLRLQWGWPVCFHTQFLLSGQWVRQCGWIAESALGVARECTRVRGVPWSSQRREICHGPENGSDWGGERRWIVFFMVDDPVPDVWLPSKSELTVHHQDWLLSP